MDYNESVDSETFLFGYIDEDEYGTVDCPSGGLTEKPKDTMNACLYMAIHYVL